MGKDNIYFVDWDDKVDDDLVFDHVKCSIFDNTQVAPDEDPPLKVILRIYFTTSCITIQGSELMWFSSVIFPQIKDKFNSLLESSPHVNLNNLPVTAPASVSQPTLLSGKEYASSAALNHLIAIIPSCIPQPVKSFSPRQVRSPIPTGCSHIRQGQLQTQAPQAQIDLANLESKLAQTLQLFEKIVLENFLGTV